VGSIPTPSLLFNWRLFNLAKLDPKKLTDVIPPEPTLQPELQPELAKPQHLDYFNWDEELKLRVAKSLAPEYKSLVANWSNCERCPLHGTRQHVLFARGSLPADVVFISEHPTSLDDDEGFPLSGPLGRLFDTVIRDLEKSRTGWKWAVMEPLGCVPWQQIESQQYKQSTMHELTPCDPRFVELLKLANPSGIVLLGRNVENYWTTNGPRISAALGRKLPACYVHHPREILRQGGASPTNETYQAVTHSLKRFVFNTLGLGT